MQELHHRLLTDLRRIGITETFDLELRQFSKTYYGRYNPNTNRVTIYVYEDKKCTKLIKYEDLFLTLIHEAVHCIQWHDESFVRVRGVMHDSEFFQLYNRFSDRAKALLLFEEVRNDTIHKAYRRKAP